ncbi:hypothetical protein NSQ59_07535 [Margalitia sp. FSL K6-0131]|uniref:hypothetical protein n=1 Tax=Margalitia sp. FSL K6-0131 TaxID=2954604 RepID=UPI0030FB4A0D
MEEINHKIELSWDEYQLLKSDSKKYHNLHRSLLEYMGYEDEYLITRAGLKKLKRDDLVTIVLEQRNMIRKLIDDLDPLKRDAHIDALDNLYMDKGKE